MSRILLQFIVAGVHSTRKKKSKFNFSLNFGRFSGGYFSLLVVVAN